VENLAGLEERMEKEFEQVVVVNLTPHLVVLKGTTEVIIHPSGSVARVATEQETVARLWGEIPIVRTKLGAIQGLPEAKPGKVLYIVSSMVAQAAASIGRFDVAAPDTGPTAVRGEDGQVKAVRRLQVFW